MDVVRRGRDAVLQLLVRTFVMRGITVLGTIVLARLLSPADFGVFAVLVLWMNVLIQLGDFGLGASLVQQREEPTATERGTAFAVQLVVLVPIAIVIWLAAPLIASYFGELGADFVWQLRLIALTVLTAAVRAVPAAMLVRELRFGVLARIEVTQHVVFYATAIVLALAGAGAWSFVVAVVLQASVGCTLVLLAWGHLTRPSFRLDVFRRQLHFGVAVQATTLMGSAYATAVPIFGGLAGGVAAIGQLQFAVRIGTLASFLDDILGRVTFPAFSRLQHDREQLGRIVRDVIVVTTIAGAGVQGWLAAAAPSVVPLVFGDQWIPAVAPLQLLCVGAVMATPIRFLRSLLLSLGRARSNARFMLIMTMVLFLVFPPLLFAFGLVGGGLAFVIAQIVGLVLPARAVRSEVPPIWADYARILALGVASAVPAWLVVDALPRLPGTIVSAIVFALCYGGLLWVFARVDLHRGWSLLTGQWGASAAAGAPVTPPEEITTWSDESLLAAEVVAREATE